VWFLVWPAHLLVPSGTRVCVMGGAGRGRVAAMPSGCCSCLKRVASLRTVVETRASIVERAFEIARSGEVADIAALRAVLINEGYANAAQILGGRSLKLQLTRMITEARMAKPRRP